MNVTTTPPVTPALDHHSNRRFPNFEELASPAIVFMISTRALGAATTGPHTPGPTTHAGGTQSPASRCGQPIANTARHEMTGGG